MIIVKLGEARRQKGNMYAQRRHLKGKPKKWKGVQAANRQVADLMRGQRERVGSHARIGAKHINAYQTE